MRNAIIWIIIFTTLPLQPFTATPIPFLIGLCSVYAMHWYAGREKLRGIAEVVAASIVLLLPFSSGRITPQSAQATLLVLLVIWSVPILAYLIKYERKKIAILLISSLTIHAQWALLQFNIQQDLNMHLIGESTLVIGQPAIATFTGIDGSKYLRAYGPYPHPNSLAGSLLMGLIVTLVIDHSKKKRLHLPLSLNAYFIFLALIISFSRAAWFGFFILIAVSYWTKTKKIRATPLLITMATLSILIMIRLPIHNEAAINERISSNHWALQIIRDSSVWSGIGLGNYESTLNKYFQDHNIKYEPWQVTPVHNVPLLITAELGLLPILLLASWLVYRFAPFLRRRWLYLTPLFPLASFDHYLITQPAPLMYLLLTLLLVADSPPRPRASRQSPPTPPAATVIPIPTRPTEPALPQS